jgi:hypothetical protein
MRVRGFFGRQELQPRAAGVPPANARSELVATCHDQEGCPRGPATMPAESQRGSEDPAELVAYVSALKRDVLLRVHRHRLGFEDLEDCYSQATLELVCRARTRARAFQGEAHVANALEQRFLSRIADRRRALSGRSPIAAVTQVALRRADDQDAGPDGAVLAAVADPTGDVVERLAGQDDVRRLRELADELTADQRLVLACQVALDMDCHGSLRALRAAARPCVSPSRRGPCLMTSAVARAAPSSRVPLAR